MYRCFLFIFIFLVLGCGNGHVKGSGTVRFSSGEPVPFGMVYFTTTHYNYFGTIKDGVFDLGGLREFDGLPPGMYKVYFIGTDPNTEQSIFADKYLSSETSDIKVEVKTGQRNRFEFIVEKGVVN